MSFKELKKNYHVKKKCFTKNVQSAIESTQEIHSGWLKVRTSIKRWYKVWCQVKPGYLILYTSQEALKKHRLGVVILTVCQVIRRPTKKDGVCFKLINPFDYSVWAKSSTKALIFKRSSLMLRVSDDSISKLWLDALHQCELAANLEGYQPVINEDDYECNNRPPSRNNLSDTSSCGDDDANSSKQQLNIMLSTTTTSENDSVCSYKNSKQASNSGSTGQRFADSVSKSAATHSYINNCTTDKKSKNKINQGVSSSSRGNASPLNSKPKQSSSLHNDLYLQGKDTDFNHNVISTINPNGRSATVTKNNSNNNLELAKYSWDEMKLEKINYVEDDVEELGSAGMQSEEVHDSNKNFLWHIIKQLRPGMDLSKVTLPTFILEPRSFLEKLADYYYHCDILSDAALIDDPTLRMVNVVKWYLSGFYKKPKGPKKPYNPILGERFRCFWVHPRTLSRTFFIAEQVSHHPPISAFHVANKKDGFTITCALLSRSKYSGNSVSAILDGKAKLYFNRRDETYTLTMPFANCRGILLGSLCLELGGRVEIECNKTGCKAELDFKLAPIWASASSYNLLTGKILKDNKVIYTLDGHWDKKIFLVDKRTEHKSVLWEVTDTVRQSRLKRYSVKFEDQQERESVKLWSKVTAALTQGDQATATNEKTLLEEMQRHEARERRGQFKPDNFEFRNDINEWTYKWQDDRTWDAQYDIMQFEESFKIKTLMLDPTSSSSFSSAHRSSAIYSSRYNPNIDTPLTPTQADQVRSMERKHRHSIVHFTGRKTEDAGVSDSPQNETFKTIESRITAGNLLFEEAIRQVNEINRKLEEDIASLKHARGKRTIAMFVTALVVIVLSMYFKYFS